MLSMRGRTSLGRLITGLTSTGFDVRTALLINCSRTSSSAAPGAERELTQREGKWQRP
jgi:hypothetical protein